MKSTTPQGALHTVLHCLAIGILALALPAAASGLQRIEAASPRLEALGNVLKAGADAARGIEPAQDSAVQDADKSTANGLVIEGTYGYNYVGNSVTLTVARIANNSSTRTTGTLRLELWATSSSPARGAGFTGYRLAVGSTFSPLSPREYYYDVTRTATFTPPPDGTYYMVLVLAEYSSTGCSQSDGYCISDSGVFSSTRTFGNPNPPPTGNVTIVARSVGLCIENYPADAYALLQQIQPGVWQSYSASTSCSSQGLPFFAGYFAQLPQLRAYTATQSDALMLCSTGLVVNCTVAPAPPAANYSDLWYNPNESGWGVAFVQHTSGMAFVAWYTYDTFGNPKWYVASSCRVAGSGCTGTLYETSGPPFGPSFDPSRVVVRTVGTISFSFSSANSGTMSYTVNGSSGTKSISRQAY